jgi:hypothetical protein
MNKFIEILARRRRFIIMSSMLAALAGSFYGLMLPGLSVADRDPSLMEVQIATWLLHQSVPEAERNRVNPLGTAGQ